MTDHEKAIVLLGQADAALTTLGTTLGTALPGLGPIRAALDRPGHHRDEVLREIRKTFRDIRDVLLGASPAAATGYGLGRMLADTVWLPRSGQPEIVLERFKTYRLTNAYIWLDDLASAFPHHAASAVTASLQAWEIWLSRQPGKTGTVGTAICDETMLRAVHLQGEMWRRLLSGEKDPMRLLRPDDYVAAGERLLQRCRQLAGRYLLKWSPFIAVFLAATSGAMWAAITYAPAGSGRLAAVLFSAAAALGLSWKGVGATLGRALNQAESAIWESEVEVAIGRASTILPRAEVKSLRLLAIQLRNKRSVGVQSSSSSP